MSDLHPIPGFQRYFITRDGAVFSTKGSNGRELRPLRQVMVGSKGYKLSPAVHLMLRGERKTKTIRQLLRITFGEPE